MSGDLPLHRNDAARAWRTERPVDVLPFHRSLPGYAPTRLIAAPTIARELGVAAVYVKEEASRFGLPAFKILGASYAVSRALSERCGQSRALPLHELRAALSSAPPIRLIAATDGNHGRAVARVAGMLGIAATIFAPVDITDAAKQAIDSEGAQRIEIDEAYDDVVLAAADLASHDDEAVLVQDTSWPGYERIPQWIVDGYATMLREVDDQLAAAGVDAVDVVAVPVGVGSLAQAVVAHYRSIDGTPPIILSVEPTAAPAVLVSLREGSPVSVPTRPTIMAGLNCGTPTGIGWPTLRDGLDRAVAVDDISAARAVRDLERLDIDSGPCGAASLAGLRALTRDDPLPATSHVLLLSTEGRAANPLPDGLR